MLEACLTYSDMWVMCIIIEHKKTVKWWRTTTAVTQCMVLIEHKKTVKWWRTTTAVTQCMVLRVSDWFSYMLTWICILSYFFFLSPKMKVSEIKIKSATLVQGACATPSPLLKLETSMTAPHPTLLSPLHKLAPLPPHTFRLSSPLKCLCI